MAPEAPVSARTRSGLRKRRRNESSDEPAPPPSNVEPELMSMSELLEEVIEEVRARYCPPISRGAAQPGTASFIRMRDRIFYEKSNMQLQLHRQKLLFHNNIRIALNDADSVIHVLERETDYRRAVSRLAIDPKRIMNRLKHMLMHNQGSEAEFDKAEKEALAIFEQKLKHRLFIHEEGPEVKTKEFGICCICQSDEVTNPKACRHCKFLIGCYECVKQSYVAEYTSDDREPRCPRCREDWNARKDFVDMDDLERRFN